MPPDLTIVIPSTSRPHLLGRCLQSVRCHAPPNVELLVVDDASRQGEVSRISQALGVPALRLAQRSGFCVAANAGVRRARSEIIQLLNDDTEVTCQWSQPALRWFRDPQVGAVAPLVLRRPTDRFSQPTVDSAGDRYFLGGVAAKRGHGEPLGTAYQVPRRVFGASASSAFYRRQAFLDSGGFPESFGAYFEDVDLAFRLNHAGYHTIFEPASRIWHVGSASYGQPGRRLLEQQSQNEERVFWRNLHGRLLVRAILWHALVLAGKACRRWQEGQLTPFLCGRLRLFGEVSDILRHRRGWASRAALQADKSLPIDAHWFASGRSPDGEGHLAAPKPGSFGSRI